MIRFAGFELDQQRAELRGRDSVPIKLRPKTFDLLILFVTNPGRILSKQELMDAVWPNVHVGDDSLFQCIRELRTALGDDQRQLVKLVSGRGYMFDADVVSEPAGPRPSPSAVPVQETAPASALVVTAPVSGWYFSRPIAAALILVGVVGLVGLAIATPILWLSSPAKRMPVVMVMPIVGASQEPEIAAMATAVTDRLVDGLARIDNITVVTPGAASTSASAKQVAATLAEPDYVVQGELINGPQTWTLRARLVKAGSGQIEASPGLTVSTDLSPEMQQSRLAAGIGHPLATRINTLVETGSGTSTADESAPSSASKVAIQQATASIVQTSRERFTAAEGMLLRALADEPNNVDLQVALAALQLRGIQMVWYSPADSAATEAHARTLLERALKIKPTSIPVLEAYCRFLNATNEFVDSLVACARVVAFDPWNGTGLYHMGVAQIQLGRFEDAVATFKQADRYDTPQVARWTWLLGVGWGYMMMGRAEEALPWLEKSIAITPASGRPLMLLASAYQRTGRTEQAKAALARAMEIRPGSNAVNIALPPKNSSAAFLAAADKIRDDLIQIGLPTH